MGPSIKYVTLFLAKCNPPIPPVTFRHTSRDTYPRKYVTHLGPPIFRRPSRVYKNPDKSPLVQILSQLFAGFLSGGFIRGSFVWKFCPGPVVLSEFLFCQNTSVTPES